MLPLLPLPSPEYFVFTLYVKDRSATSLNTYERLAQLCFKNLPGKHILRMVDLESDPAQAETQAIVATPTLDMVLPDEIKRFVGDLRESDAFVLAISRAH